MRVARNLTSRKTLGLIPYFHACTLQGALEFSGLTGDALLKAELLSVYGPLVAKQTERTIAVTKGYLVDSHAYGIVPLEMFLQTGKQDCLAAGLAIVNNQWKEPLTADGLTSQTRWWIDDMYMVGGLLNRAFHATKDPVHAERAGRFLTAYIAKLQQSNGLFFHGPAFHTFWGRGNGWVAVSTADALTIVPEKSPYRAPLLEGYRALMAGLLPYQGPNGLWRQIIDNDTAWEETSCTAMFTYAFIVGIRHGWLDPAVYGPAARKGWLGLAKHLDANGELDEVCIGTGQDKDPAAYLARPRKTGDFHGQAPLLWCANALLRDQ